MPETNWAQNHVYRAAGLERPASLDELRTILRRSGPVRILGTRHSFTDIADSGTLISLAALPTARAIRIDADAMTVRVGAAVTYAELARALDAEGLGLANLASLPHISVAGAVATATHGSGDGLGNLATAVRGMTLLTARGEELEIGAADPRLAGSAVHLGLLGAVLEITLAVVPRYELAQHVYEDLDWDELLGGLEETFALGYSVSVFHRLAAAPVNLWVKADPGATLPETVHGGHPATAQRHPIVGMSAEATTSQLGRPGVWSERLPHFRSGFLPSSGEEIQSELFVARADAPEAVHRLLELSDELAPALLVGELRTVAADALWMSPQHGRDSVGLHFTWRRQPEAVAANVARIEAVLAPLAPRPHWGKVFSIPPAALAAAYPRAPEFARLARELDPDGVFVNAWTRARLPFLLDAGSG